MSLKTDNINKLVEEALAIEAEAAKEAGALGFMARALTQATMPHRRVAESEFRRTNGAFTLVIFAPSDIGIPYGSIPRLMISWMTTEAVRTKVPELALGPTLSGFMSELDLVPTGGRWGSITRLRDQMTRLLASSVSCTYTDDHRRRGLNLQVAEEYDLWWDPKLPGQATLWQSTVVLGHRFFEEVIQNPIPVDMRALKALKRSPMALDLYCWLTYRMSYLKRLTEIPWIALHTQFGTGYPNDHRGRYDFKRALLKQLKSVLVVYPDARVSEGEYGLVLKPSSAHIPRIPRSGG